MPHRLPDGLSEEEVACWRDWMAAAAREPVAGAVCTLLDRLSAEVAERPGVCALSGRCCRFEEYEHRLYVTGLEVAWLVQRLDAAQWERLAREPNVTSLGGCVFQREGLCTVHELRPMGCRVFFCDPAAEGWQNDVYEQYLAELRELHERHGLPYRYMEWRTALAEAKAAIGD